MDGSSHASYQLHKTATADQWIQKNGAQYHEAFGNAVKIVTPQPNPQVQFSNEIWQSITSFQEYVASVKQNRRLKEYDFLTKYNAAGGIVTWEDVHKDAQIAMEAYETRGSRNWFIRVGRGTGEKVPALQSWLGLVSGNDFAAIACGVLSLFFGAATALSKVRTAVKSTMESLTSTVDDTEEMLKLYHDEKLRELAEQLLVALLNGTKDMIHWLNSHGSKEAIKAFIKQSTYAEELNTSMDLIKEKTESFRQKANNLLHARIFRLENNTFKINENVVGIDGKIERLGAEIPKYFSDAVSRVINGFRETLAASQWFPESAQVNRALAHLLGRPQVVYLPMTSADQIIEILQVHPMMTATDLAQANGHQDAFTETQNRGIQIFDDRDFRNWGTSNASEMLLVNDLDRDSLYNDSSAALTTVSAKFIDVLISLRIVVPLVFFCGAHTARDDPYSGTHGLMRSMNHQLLQQFGGSNLPFIDQQLLNGLRSHDMSCQYDLFRRLLENMQSTTVFCVIDRVADLDNGFYRQELEILVSYFRQLVINLNSLEARQQRGPILKVMFTAPAMGATMAALFQQENKVSIPDWGHDMLPGIGDSYMEDSIVGMCISSSP